MSVDGCVFCAIVRGSEPAEIVRRWRHSLAFKPLNPVTDGHLLVIPTEHFADMGDSPTATALTASAVAQLLDGSGPCNVITSKGREATQSVFHLHFHIVPRRDNDGLALPWYSGKRRKS